MSVPPGPPLPPPPPVKRLPLQTVVKCVNCEGTDFEWHCDTRKRSNVVDGRLCMHDVGVIFFLGCKECSETLQIVNGDEVANFLNQ